MPFVSEGSLPDEMVEGNRGALANLGSPGNGH